MSSNSSVMDATKSETSLIKKWESSSEMQIGDYVEIEGKFHRICAFEKNFVIAINKNKGKIWRFTSNGSSAFQGNLNEIMQARETQKIDKSKLHDTGSKMPGEFWIEQKSAIATHEVSHNLNCKKFTVA